MTQFIIQKRNGKTLLYEKGKKQNLSFSIAIFIIHKNDINFFFKIVIYQCSKDTY